MESTNTNIENKKSFFSIDLQLPKDKCDSSFYRENLKNSVDLILASMGVEEDPEEYSKDDYSRIFYFFKTSRRNRKGQLVKFCHRYLDSIKPELDYKVDGITKQEFKYEGDDIKILDKKTNWKPWQKEIFRIPGCRQKILKQQQQKKIERIQAQTLKKE